MPKVDFKSAEAIALARIAQVAGNVGLELAMMVDATKEIDEGWVFFYNSADFVRTKNPMSVLAGNCPLFVTRDGVLFQLPTAFPWEHSIQKLLSERKSSK